MAGGKGNKQEDTTPTGCACGKNAPLPYWCEVCERSVPEKRCPFCGLKAKKIR